MALLHRRWLQPRRRAPDGHERADDNPRFGPQGAASVCGERDHVQFLDPTFLVGSFAGRPGPAT